MKSVRGSMAGILIHGCCLIAWASAGTSPSPEAVERGISFETQAVRLTLSSGGEVLGLVDRQTGMDYADHAKPIKFASMHTETAAHPVTAAAADGERLRVNFGEGRSAELRIETWPDWFVIHVSAVTAPDSVKSLDLIDLPLTLKAEPGEPVAACVLALNLQTNVATIPQPSKHLQATCYARFGMPGAKAAVIVCPQPRLRDVMKQVVLAADELPHSPMGGPWALDVPVNRGSYVIDITGQTNEGNIDSWIAMLKSIGFTQLDFHTGQCLRFGDYAPNPRVHPRGFADVRAMTDKLHAAGMLAGLHTYAFFIAKDSPFVTPAPDPGLAADAAYTLVNAIAADATTIPVAESTANGSAVTGFLIRNSATLRIEDELITYQGVRKEAPFGFLECRRGAWGTQAVAHAAGAKVMHLKECFGLFVPDPDSPLFTEVIARTADAYNQGGFDMIYLDALDGSDVLRGGEYAWHYASKFTFELAKRLNKPALFEMSTFYHHLWYLRARMGAWDAPLRGHRAFIEGHRRSNAECVRYFMPGHLGWWSISNWQGIQTERTFPEIIEYLCGRCIADDCGLSFLTYVPPDKMFQSAHTKHLGRIIRQYEDLRRTNKVPLELRRRIGQPWQDHTLEMTPDGASFQFRPARYDRHTIGRVDPKGGTWSTPNRFGPQPPAIRIEVLFSAEEYDSPDATIVEDFSDPAVFSVEQLPSGTIAGITRIIDRVKTGAASGRFAVTRRPVDNPRWAMVGRKFSPCINLANKALGFWVYGDGKGELLNVQTRCPLEAVPGVAERYAKIDFTGWKYIELIEPESDDIPKHDWPYAGELYALFQYWVSYDRIEQLNLWYGDLPADAVSCDISPIQALPLKPGKMRNPTVAVDGRPLVFPTDLESGQYLECRHPGDCKVYDANGHIVAEIAPRGDWLDLAAGDNSITFSAEPLPGPHPRAAVTIITRGDPLVK